jgi:hydroxymethylpyrimidine pyrophosphatase-like HAD family hydrolase
MTNKTRYICIDLDGTIAAYSGWQGPAHFGEPLPGVRAALGKLKEKGWRIIVFTTRGDVASIRDYLESHDIPFDYINENPDQPAGTNTGKPVAQVYVDDRAVQFQGNWTETLDEILDFRPWMHQDDW